MKREEDCFTAESLRRALNTKYWLYDSPEFILTAQTVLLLLYLLFGSLRANVSIFELDSRGGKTGSHYSPDFILVYATQKSNAKHLFVLV